MRSLLILSAWSLLLSSCNLTESLSIEINPRPVLRVGYEYLNDSGRNTLSEEAGRMDIFVFDGVGHFVSQLAATSDEIIRPDGVMLLDGVPEDTYTVVSLANAEQSRYPALQPGISTLADLQITLDPETPHETSDRLLHSLNRYIVRRGGPALHTVSLDKLYYTIDLTIVGAEYTMEEHTYTVGITGTAAGFDALGNPIRQEVIVRPELERVGDRLCSRFTVCKFDRQDAVRILLQTDDKSVTDIALSEYIEQNDIGIDFQRDRDIVIPVTLKVSSTGVTVTINGWEVAQIQFPALGA